MEKSEKQKQIEQEYGEKVKEYTPTHSLPKEMAKAFLVGGAICTLGQVIINISSNYGLNKDDAGTVCTICLILFSVLLTGFNIYPNILPYSVCMY